jgi:hypothetical protein
MIYTRAIDNLPQRLDDGLHMDTLAKRESLPAVTAAGVIAIIFSALGGLLGLLVEVAMLVAPGLQSSEAAPSMPPGTRAAAEIFWLFGLAVAAFGLFTGIGVLRRRTWARITMIVWGGIMVVFSAISIPIILIVFSSLPSTLPPGAATGPFMGFLKVFMVLFYGIPLGIGVWWLVLFTRPRVAAAFASPLNSPAYPPTADASAFAPQAPAPLKSFSPRAACPLPLMILAGFLIFSGVCTVLVAVIPMTGSVPFFFFGYFLSGVTAKVFLGLLGAVFGVAGVGILKLKPEALYTLLIVQCVFFLNGILSALNPRFLAAMQEAMQRADAENPSFPGGNPFLTGSLLHSFLIFGLCVGAAIIGLLLFYRSRFLEAALAAKE